MFTLPRHLLFSEQFGSWKERNIHVPRRAKQIAERNAAIRSAELRNYLKNSFCTKPFDTMETTDEGLVHMCCPDWLPTPIGHIDALQSAWKSAKARDIRESIIDGSFAYCSHLDCALVSGRRLLSRDSDHAQAFIKKYEKDKSVPPVENLIFSHDRSCNLSCPSCRTRNIAVGKAKQKKLDDQIERSFLTTLKDAKRVYITGSGDPFGSAHFRRLIKRLSRSEFPNLKVNLHTNGQLWDERAWKELDLSRRVEEAHISIDAASADVYSIVRRGGSFERLLKNLIYIKSLREAEEFNFLVLSMVVQSTNFHQMSDFVRLAKSHSADLVTFQMIRDWGTLKSFDEHYIGPGHPKFPDFVKALDDPQLHLAGVDIGNIIAHTRLD